MTAATSTETIPGEGPEPARGLTPMARVKRVVLVCLMSITTINVWTGSPMLAVWVGSRVQGAGGPTMGAFAVVGLTLAAVSFSLVRVLARLEAVYDRVTGRERSVRRHVPWLRSMRGERPHEHKGARQLSPLDVVLIVTVVIAVVAFEVWFFFFSGSPIDGRSGRH
jgi:hypothetical protein